MGNFWFQLHMPEFVISWIKPTSEELVPKLIKYFADLDIELHDLCEVESIGDLVELESLKLDIATQTKLMNAVDKVKKCYKNSNAISSTKSQAEAISAENGTEDESKTSLSMPCINIGTNLNDPLQNEWETSMSAISKKSFDCGVDSLQIAQLQASESLDSKSTDASTNINGIGNAISSTSQNKDATEPYISDFKELETKQDNSEFNGRVVSLANLGQTCFMNAALQVSCY